MMCREVVVLEISLLGQGVNICLQGPSLGLVDYLVEARILASY